MLDWLGWAGLNKMLNNPNIANLFLPWLGDENRTEDNTSSGLRFYEKPDLFN